MMNKLKAIVPKIVYCLFFVYIIKIPISIRQIIDYNLDLKPLSDTIYVIKNTLLTSKIEFLATLYVLPTMFDITESIKLYNNLKDEDRDTIKLKERSNFNRHKQVSFPYIISILNFYLLYKSVSFYNIKILSLRFIVILAIGLAITLFLYYISEQTKSFFILYDNTH